MSKYRFTTDYQSLVVAALIGDPSLLAESRDSVRAEFFDSHAEQEIVRIILEFFDRFRQRPSRDTLVQLIHDRAGKLGWDPKDRDSLVGDLYRILGLTFQEADVARLRLEVTKFGRIQALKLAMLESISVIGESEKGGDVSLDQVEVKIRKALTVGSTKSIGISLSQVLPNMKALCADTGLGSIESRVLTGFPTIDKYLKGGPGAGEIAFVIAPSNKGKSMILANIAASAFKQGCKVLFFTFEMKEPEVASRIAANLTDTEIDKVQQNDPAYIQKINDLKFIIDQRNMRIVYVKPSEATANNLRSIIMQIETLEGWTPGLIVVDYLDEMAVVSGGQDEDSLYQAYGKLTTDLLSISVDYKCPLWTASQVNRDGYADAGASLANTGRSMQKIDKAEFVITPIVSDEMAKSGKMVIRILKNRRGPGVGARIACTTNLAKAKIIEDVKR